MQILIFIILGCVAFIISGLIVLRWVGGFLLPVLVAAIAATMIIAITAGYLLAAKWVLSGVGL